MRSGLFALAGFVRGFADAAFFALVGFVRGFADAALFALVGFARGFADAAFFEGARFTPDADATVRADCVVRLAFAFRGWDFVPAVFVTGLEVDPVLAVREEVRSERLFS